MIDPQSFIHNSKTLRGIKMFCSVSVLCQWKKLTLFTIGLPMAFLYRDSWCICTFY